jgi:hypothetical protein
LATAGGSKERKEKRYVDASAIATDLVLAALFCRLWRFEAAALAEVLLVVFLRYR